MLVLLSVCACYAISFRSFIVYLEILFSFLSVEEFSFTKPPAQSVMEYLPLSGISLTCILSGVAEFPCRILLGLFHKE